MSCSTLPPRAGGPRVRGALWCLGVLLSSTLTAFGADPPELREDPAEDPRYRTLTIIQPVAGGNAEKAMMAYHRHKADVSVTPEQLSKMSLADRRKALAPVVDMMVKMYNAGGGGAKSFKNVAHIIAKGIEKPSREFLEAGFDPAPVPDRTSVLMAHARETMIDGVLEKIMNDPKSPIGEPGTWKILRSDSGNTSSGLKSDLDQTVYVLKQDANGRWVHAPEADRALREAFQSTWGTTPDTQGISLEMLDIATIEGRNRFPDPRAYEVANSDSKRRSHSSIDKIGHRLGGLPGRLIVSCSATP